MNYKKVVIKIGTNVLTKEDGKLDTKVIKDIVDQVAKLKKQNIEVILVSSGAMGAGRTMIDLQPSSSDVSKRQILSAVGQIKLMETYKDLFSKHKMLCAQVLATKEDFRDRNHYLNMRNCFTALLHDKIVPIVNENDVVSISELMFTDNDELAGLIAAMMNVDAVIILTCVEGIFDRDPKEKDAKIIRQIDPIKDNFKKFIAPTKSLMGRGGMITKGQVAAKLSKLGITTHIAHGKSSGALVDILKGKEIGTTFTKQKKTSSVKKWIAHSTGQEKGKVFINEGAQKIIYSKSKAASLLPIGITKIEGSFQKGDLLKIFNQSGKDLGLGIAQYGSSTAKKYIGKKNKKELIHYNYLYLED